MARAPAIYDLILFAWWDELRIIIHWQFQAK
jgi:hypothetical protein